MLAKDLPQCVSVSNRAQELRCELAKAVTAAQIQANKRGGQAQAANELIALLNVVITALNIIKVTP